MANGFAPDHLTWSMLRDGRPWLDHHVFVPPVHPLRNPNRLIIARTRSVAAAGPRHPRL